MHGGMTAVRSIVRVPSGFPEKLGALGIGDQSIICGMCIAVNDVYACMKVCGCVYARYVCRANV